MTYWELTGNNAACMEMLLTALKIQHQQHVNTSIQERERERGRERERKSDDNL